jgi:hypothetical protein
VSDYHIAEKSSDGRTANLYVHLAVPATENVAGVALGGGVTITYQDAQSEKLAKDNPDGFTSKAPGILAGEQTQLDNGELIEKIHRFRFSKTDLTNAERQAEIEGGNDNETGIIQWKTDISNADSDLYKELIEPLAWWGYYRDV